MAGAAVFLFGRSEPARAQSFTISGSKESNRHFRVDFPSATSAYYLIQAADGLTNPVPWSLTGVVLGVEGTQFWRNPGALEEAERRYYRVARRDQSDPADSDSDGMDDVWELRYELQPLDPTDATKDPDEDGFTNLEEYQAGADPQHFDPPPELAITSPRDGDWLP